MRESQWNIVCSRCDYHFYVNVSSVLAICIRCPNCRLEYSIIPEGCKTETNRMMGLTELNKGMPTIDPCDSPTKEVKKEQMQEATRIAALNSFNIALEYLQNAVHNSINSINLQDKKDIVARYRNTLNLLHKEK